MSKIKLLVIDIQNAGVGKFRFRDPHIALQKNFKEEFHIDIMANPPLGNKKFYSQYDGVFAQGSLVLRDEIFELLEHLRKEGIKIILDLDDYWRLPASHAMYKKLEDNWKKLTSRLKVANLITTTTKELAKKIMKHNKKVAVVPNAIIPTDKQFQPNPIPSNRVRIGWVGGSSHGEDLKLLRGVFGKLKNISVDTQMVMCGFNNLSRDINTGKTEKVAFPKVWMQCESILTNNYSVDEEYRHWLLRPVEAEYPNVENKEYRRIWTKDVSEYGTCYNHIDIALAPLVDNNFNAMKSQLKVLEAGFHRKPLIVSEISPYLIDCVHGKNAFIVPEKRKHKDWFKYCKMLALEPNLREDMGEALYETVKNKYNQNRLSNFRAQLYRKYLSDDS
jgi:glycosyltransferase involved in cell wall biosynthesis